MGTPWGPDQQGFGCQTKQFEFCSVCLKVVVLNLILVIEVFKNLLIMTSPLSTKFYNATGEFFDPLKPILGS